MKRTFEIQPWNIVTHELKHEDKRLLESMTSLGNEHMGLRGFFEEDYSGDSLEGTYIGGVWYPDKTKVGWWKNGYPEYFGKVINAVNFIKMHIKVNGELVDLAKDTFTDFELNLDMKLSKLIRQFTVTKGKAQVQFTFERFLSADQEELADVYVTATNVGEAPVEIEIQSLLEGDVHNEDANYGESFWNILAKDQSEMTGSLLMETTENLFNVPQFVVGAEMTHVTTMKTGTNDVLEKAVVNTFSETLAPKESASLEKRVIIVTSRDYDTIGDLEDAMHALSVKVAHETRANLQQAHEAEWQKRWEQSDIEIKGDEAAQQGIRFNLYQLFSTYYGKDSRLNIGPKGFTGEKYGGATYWDTEAFCLPVYLGTTKPEVSRQLLMYRYQQLPGAYHNAREQGLAGALYPMVTFNGIECHNEWEITFEEIHRNGDIAFAIYNYTRYTGDTSYVLHEGSEVLMAIARFWADRVHFSQRHQQYMIHGVTGADEYQNNVDNNWYTNSIARWCLQYALDILEQVDEQQAAKLAVSPEEKAQWQDIVERMYLPYDEDLDIFVQHDGFLDKAIVLDENNNPINQLSPSERPINQHWSWDKILRSPYIKQADVLQQMWYFIDEFTEEEKKRNFDFYEPLTVHESSLSASIYSIMAADVHYEDKAVEMYERTARLDLDNYNNDTEDGLHITSMSGSWLAIVQGFAGMRIRNNRLHFDPFLPQKWEGYTFRIFFRDRLIEVEVDAQQTNLRLIKGESIEVDLAGDVIVLEEGNHD